MFSFLGPWKLDLARFHILPKSIWDEESSGSHQARTFQGKKNSARAITPFYRLTGISLSRNEWSGHSDGDDGSSRREIPDVSRLPRSEYQWFFTPSLPLSTALPASPYFVGSCARKIPRGQEQKNLFFTFLLWSSTHNLSKRDSKLTLVELGSFWRNVTNEGSCVKKLLFEKWEIRKADTAFVSQKS